ncbi:MAG: PD-(D/E)XK nuclease-like domain-containing protein [Microbacterium ginsengisoli]|uniref:PD-(D/E)XK nuclease-like domain-containing protein n=1 Tax=Microbacterium TaxID=33882 RepID=UPI0006F421EF|nr:MULTISPECIES: PD-(D/E)XK nuclease-like domain-containing protein [unclassified Microbacterium]KQR90990.1 hypothetical protein ASF93_08725 [Microbacterium sp. Leaf347]KQS00012.1 hypothetical protein ASG00_10995 [Microbacterium sp. Leaf351]MBN9199714.1 PD-(D/E)XK nuclease-like domain-containing protein [Microbacterium ginsengisoli]OJU75241.1 MAG: hypothetical protein BGO15_04230 [Microbacterium sp. 71-23]
MTESLSGVVLGLPEDEYHAHPALSSTGARQLLIAPAKFLFARSAPRVHKKAFDVGTAAHSRVLGTGWEIVAIPDSVLAVNGAASTAKAKAFIEEARANGQVPIKQAEFDEVTAMSEAVLAHPSARILLEQDGAAEASVFGVDPETGVETRARFDFLGRGSGRRVGVDLKTLHGEASPVKFAKTVADHGYHVQGAHYEDTLRFVGEHIDAFAFIAVEKEPPYLVGVFVLNEDYREIGAARARRARHLFARGIQDGIWPGYPDEIQIARPPQWAIYDHIDTEALEK